MKPERRKKGSNKRCHKENVKFHISTYLSIAEAYIPKTYFVDWVDFLPALLSNA